MIAPAGPLHLRLPATSANLGPGFDAVGLAMALYLTIDATVSETFRIDASGRDADLCADVEHSLILTTYREIIGPSAPQLALTLQNEIPLGMGCGSSAAALLAGVVLANHFGQLGWTDQQILEEACKREGHPDNVAACWLGGMTCSMSDTSSVITATCGIGLKWNLIVALPVASLATSKARALLPATYSAADAVQNVQSTALLVAAFTQGRGELLRYAMRDRLHQPYREGVCPLLPALMPLTKGAGVLGIALSGAGPSVLLILDEQADLSLISEQVTAFGSTHLAEILHTKVASGCVVTA